MQAIRNLAFPMLLLLGASPVLGAAPPWERGPFEAEPDDLLKAADGVERSDEGGDTELLYHHVRYEFAEDGTFVVRTHAVRRVLGDRADNRVTAKWRPELDRRPTIRARLITPGGREVVLAANDVQERAAFSRAGVLSDDRMLFAALPVGPPGSLIEVEVVRPVSPVLAKAGLVEPIAFRQPLPVHATRIEIVSPAETRVRTAVRDAKLEPTTSTRDGRRHVEYRVGRLASFFGLQEEERDALGPRDLMPRVVVWTGRDWNTVAAEYARVVEPRCVPTEELTAIGRRLAKETKSRDALLLAAMDEVDRLVPVYTSYAFGDRSIIPAKPERTIARTRGDCKDQSTLLVTLLREAGAEAQLALVTTSGQPVDAETPGLEAFDHVIVRVRDGDGFAWVDPTARFVRPGRLPATLQGTRALVVDDGTRELVELPRDESTSNRLSTTWEVRLRPNGEADGTVDVEAVGRFADLRRFNRAEEASASDEDRRFQREYERDVEWTAEDVQRFSATAARDFSGPFRTRHEITGSARLGNAGQGEATVFVEEFSLFDTLPWQFDAAVRQRRDDPALAERFADRDSDEPIEIPVPHVTELTVRIVPPRGFGVVDLPEPVSFRAGPVRFTRTVERPESGVVTVHSRLDTGDGILRPREMDDLVDEFIELSADFPETGMPVVMLRMEALADFEANRPREAFAALNALAADDPTGGYRVVLAEALADRGLVPSARRVMDTVVADLPNSAMGWERHAFVYMFGVNGREAGRGWEPEIAEKSLRRSIELRPTTLASWNLAVTLCRHEDGNLTADRERLEEVIGICRRLYEEEDLAVLAPLGVDQTLCACLFALGRDREILKLTETIPETRAVTIYQFTARVRRTGVPASLRWLRTNVPDPSLHLGGGLRLLVDYGEYEHARGIGDEIERRFPNESKLPLIANLINRARRSQTYESPDDPFESPTTLIRELYARMFAGPDRCEPIGDLFLSGRVGSQVRSIRGGFADGIPAGAFVGAHPDLTFMVPMEVEGLPADGARVRCRDRDTWFVVPTADGLRLVDGGYYSVELGAAALDLLADHPKVAERLLDWAAETRYSPNLVELFDPNRGTAFIRIRKLAKPGDVENATALAAAALAAESIDEDQLKRARAILEKGLKDAKPPLAHQIRRSLLGLYARLRLDREVIAMAKTIEDSDLADRVTFDLRSNALMRMGQWDELERQCDAFEKTSRRTEHGVRGALALHAGDLDACERAWSRIREDEERRSLLGLLALHRGETSDEVKRDIEALESYGPRDQLLTALLVERGEWLAALKPLGELLDIAEDWDDEDADDTYYVVGRMAEMAGRPREALEAYARVPARSFVTEMSFHALAQRRIEALRVGGDDTP